VDVYESYGLLLLITIPFTQVVSENLYLSHNSIYMHEC
jgi:hypothetical protein